MIKIKDPDHNHDDFIWVAEIDYDGTVSRVVHHTNHIQLGEYAYEITTDDKPKNPDIFYDLNELSDEDLLEAKMGVSGSFRIATFISCDPF